jgi:phosphatidylserine/phosphatidylglycerophosphate/cardiolipin synthase-like enzyme
MIEQLLSLSERDMQEISAALRSGRIASPFSAVSIQRTVAKHTADRAASALTQLASEGFSASQIVAILELLRADRANRVGNEDSFHLVTTGPEVEGITNRDTSVVVRELFANAKESVLVAGYTIYQGQRVFQALADRMAEIPNLRVRLFLDIQRQHGDTSTSQAITNRFADRFKNTQWPKDRRLPDVFFDPRSLECLPEGRACLHAKTVVVDARHVFISSANFTEAAQYRNIEVGLLVDSSALSLRLTEFFDKLVSASSLQSLPRLTQHLS